MIRATQSTHRRGRLEPRASAGYGTRHATLFGVVDQGVVSLANFATTVIVGRLAGVTALGEYSLAFTILVLLMTLQDCLLASPYSAVCHQLPRPVRRIVAGNLLLVGAICSAVAALCVLVSGEIVRGVDGLERFAAIAPMLALAIPAALIRELVRRLTMAHLHVRTALGIDIAASVLQIAILVLLVTASSITSQGALFAIALGGFGGVGIAMLAEGREWRVHLRALPRHLRRAIAFGNWLVAARVTSVLHSYAVPWLLGISIGLDAVGGFTAAFGLIAVANPMVVGLLNVMAPQAAHALAAGGVAAMRHVMLRGVVILTGVTVLLAALVATFANEILRELYGSQYVAYGNTAAVLAISLVTSGIATPAEYGLRALQRPAGSFVASLCGLIVTILGTLSLAPVFGAIGGAWSLTLGSAISSAGRWLALHRLLQQRHAPAPPNGTAERVAEVW